MGTGVGNTNARGRIRAVRRNAGARAAGSQRRCIATGEVRDRSRLLRFVVGPGGELVPDVAARLPGRGLWMTPQRDILESAIARRLFARSARQSVAAPPGLADRTEALLVQRCLEMIGLARRAGLAVGGFEKVHATVQTGTVGLLLLALDGAEGGRRKVGAIASGLPVAIVLTATEMGSIFGREHVVNIAIRNGRLCDRLVALTEKIAGFRPGAVVDPRMGPAPGRHGKMVVLDRDERRK